MKIIYQYITWLSMLLLPLCSAAQYPTAAVISGNQTVVEGTVPTPIIVQTPAGNHSYGYWEQSVDGQSWQAAKYDSGSSYEPGVLFQTAHYRYAAYSSLWQGAVYSNTVTIEVLPSPNLNPGSISCCWPFAQSGRNPSRIESDLPAFGGEYEYIYYQWEKNEGQVWEVIPGATELTYQPSGLRTTTSYRRAATSCNGTWVYSNEVTITVPDAPCILAIEPRDETVSGNGAVRLAVTLANSTGCGKDLSGAYFRVYSGKHGSLSISYSSMEDVFISYPRNLSCSWIDDELTIYEDRTGFSTHFKIMQEPDYTSLVPSSISGDQLINHGDAAGDILIVTPAGSRCGVLYSVWQKSTDEGQTWYDINADGSSSYSPGQLEQTTRFRHATYFRQGIPPSCSNEVSIVVKSVPAPQQLSPSADRSYILSYTPQQAYQSIEGKPIDSLAPQIVYYDGLGRPEQEIAVMAGPTYRDVITPIAYDSSGRKDKDYLPYTASTGYSAYKAGAPAAQASWYDSCYTAEGAFASGRRRYEASPLSRVLEEHLPGSGKYAEQDGATVRYEYGTNAQGEVAFWTSQRNDRTYYNPGTLHKETITSPDERATVRFTDLQGRVVEEHQADQSNSAKLVTSYSYDALGRLCLVVPPKAQADYLSDAEWESLVYRYTYDHRGRCIEKKLPDSEPSYYVYDYADRLAASQDGNQRNRSEWTHYYYDRFGREVAVATANHGTGLHNMRGSFEHRVEYTDYDPTCGYPITHFQNSLLQFLTFTYYDSYNRMGYSDPENADRFTSRYGQPTGQVTTRIVRRIDAGGNWPEEVQTAYYYDDNRRAVEEHSFTEHGGKEQRYTTYSFTGQPLQSETQHQLTSGGTTTTEKYGYSYDHRGRLTQLQHGLDSMGIRTIAAYTYDELGREQKKVLGDGVETVATTYDIRGRLTERGGEAFRQWLYYDTSMPGEVDHGYLKKYYGGDIRGMRWAQKGREEQNGTYSYDDFGRLLYYDHSGNRYGNFNYDDNGNMLSLLIMDGQNQLIVQAGYSGNQVDRANGLAYAYDANGNMSHDGLRGTTIQYNRLNLPQTVSWGNEMLTYGYLADGQKREKKLNGTATQYYRNGMVYAGDGTPEYVLTPEGMVRNVNGTWVRQYNLTDHLGNVRAVLDENGAILQQTDYHPFGAAYTLDNVNENRYLYGGKELQDETLGGTPLNLYDFEARFYDPQYLLRFTGIDPMAEKRFNISPYAYCSNNPISRVDPTGMWDDDYFSTQGRYLGSDNASTDYLRIMDGAKLLSHVGNSSDAKKTMKQTAEIVTQLQSGDLPASTGEAISNSITEVSLSNDAIDNIVNHYDGELGAVEGKIANVEVSTGSLDPKVVMEAEYNSPTKVFGITLSGEKNSINVNVKSGKMSDLLNSGSNIKNSLVHEYKHVSDRKRSQSPRESEIRAIEAQRNHPTWEKTTASYKKNIRWYEEKNK